MEITNAILIGWAFFVFLGWSDGQAVFGFYPDRAFCEHRQAYYLAQHPQARLLPCSMLSIELERERQQEHRIWLTQD